MKYLIVGLGNIGPEYANTRHNIGFRILDALAEASNIFFKSKRYGEIAEYKFKARTVILLKPSTYMNLSGKAVNFWLQKSKVDVKNLLVLVDDLALPFGHLRMRTKGGDGGHNGLRNINEILGHNNYARLRFGINDSFGDGQQVNYVLSPFSQIVKGALYNVTIETLAGPLVCDCSDRSADAGRDGRRRQRGWVGGDGVWRYAWR